MRDVKRCWETAVMNIKPTSTSFTKAISRIVPSVILDSVTGGNSHMKEKQTDVEEHALDPVHPHDRWEIMSLQDCLMSGV